MKEAMLIPRLKAMHSLCSQATSIKGSLNIIPLYKGLLKIFNIVHVLSLCRVNLI